MAALAEAEAVPPSSQRFTWSFRELCDVLVGTCFLAAACRGLNIAVSASFLFHGAERKATFRTLFAVSYAVSLLAFGLFLAVFRLLQLFRDHLIHPQCIIYGFGVVILYEIIHLASLLVAGTRATRYLGLLATFEVIFFLTLARDARLARSYFKHDPDAYSLFEGRIQRLSPPPPPVVVVDAVELPI